jgi:hypothetical protein
LEHHSTTMTKTPRAIFHYKPMHVMVLPYFSLFFFILVLPVAGATFFLAGLSNSYKKKFGSDFTSMNVVLYRWTHRL